MTRSVEIPEAAEVAATEAALAAGFVDPDDGTIPQWLGDGKPPVWTHPSEAVKVILAAALPYLAPAGDGGLREALEKLADELDSGNVVMVAGRALRDLAAAHPATPAVPQPVDREAPTREQIAEAVTAAWVPLDVGCEKIVDAVMAVFAGEQEQVESQQ